MKNRTCAGAKIDAEPESRKAVPESLDAKAAEMDQGAANGPTQKEKKIPKKKVLSEDETARRAFEKDLNSILDLMYVNACSAP